MPVVDALGSADTGHIQPFPSPDKNRTNFEHGLGRTTYIQRPWSPLLDIVASLPPIPSQRAHWYRITDAMERTESTAINFLPFKSVR
jgi:hypothetical protein